MIEVESQLHSALKEYFGFDAFKGNQEEIIRTILQGHDTFVIMPTGGGKSLCYQLPALLTEGTTIIVSPLIALMKNQVDAIRSYSGIDHIAHFLNSSLTRTQTKKVKDDLRQRRTKLLYVAPETLTKQENLDFFKEIDISFVAVDEAHCISEWGHDFRPEYRRIKQMLRAIGRQIPIIALTATATPKVRDDITKNLQMREPQVFVSSFNRPNLHYEVRPKGQNGKAEKNIIQFIKKNPGKSGIIYVLSRKAAEQVAETLRVNDIKAAPYHAGLESERRIKTQDDFLMERIDVVVATIAFGMGIDKPDIRFVIHYNLPKSIENYYQETGRAGRDGLEGTCILYYNPKDVYKLEKFMRDKGVAEREMGSQLIDEMVAYSESPVCRRKFLLHYFGEEYHQENCGKCDNCLHPPQLLEGKNDIHKALSTVKATKENHRINQIVDIIRGKKTKEIREYGYQQLEMFGTGSDKSEHYWSSVTRQSIIKDLLRKDIENYGLLKLTNEGKDFLATPYSVTISMNEETKEEDFEETEEGKKAVLDPALLNHLKDLRKKVAQEKNLPPFVIFQDPSLEDMATQYPVTTDELAKVSGVSKSKASRFGQPFVETISNYVEENDIERPEDFIVKSVVNKAGLKVYIIQSVDKKLPLEDIAKAKDLSLEELIDVVDRIVSSGTKLDINYYIDDVVDEEHQDIIYDYFQNAETDSLDEAFEELKDEGISYDDIKLMRIKFMSEMAN